MTDSNPFLEKMKRANVKIQLREYKRVLSHAIGAIDSFMDACQTAWGLTDEERALGEGIRRQLVSSQRAINEFLGE